MFFRPSSLTFSLLGSLSLVTGLDDVSAGHLIGLVYVVGGLFVAGAAWFEPSADVSLPTCLAGGMACMIGAGLWAIRAASAGDWIAAGLVALVWLAVAIGSAVTLWGHLNGPFASVTPRKGQ